MGNISEGGHIGKQAISVREGHIGKQAILVRGVTQVSGQY